MSERKPLYQWKDRRCRRGAAPCRHADRRLQWRFLHFRAYAPLRTLGGDDVWRIDGLLTPKNFTAMGVFRNDQISHSNPDHIAIRIFVYAPPRRKLSQSIDAGTAATAFSQCGKK